MADPIKKEEDKLQTDPVVRNPGEVVPFSALSSIELEKGPIDEEFRPGPDQEQEQVDLELSEDADDLENVNRDLVETGLEAPDTPAEETAAGGFVLSTLDQEFEAKKDGTLTTEEIIEAGIQQSDMLDEEEKKVGLLSAKVDSLEFTSEEILKTQILKDIDEILEQGPQKRTLAEIYFDKTYPSLAAPIKTELTTMLDTRIAWDRNMNTMAANVGKASMKEVVETEFRFTIPLTDDIIEDIKSNAGQEPLLVPGSRTFADRNAELSPELLDKHAEILQREYGVLAPLVSVGGTSQHVLGLSQYYPSSSTSRNIEIRSVGDFLNFLNMVPNNPDIEVDYWRFTKKVLNGEWEDGAGRFARQARRRWGPHWSTRLALFAMKEIGIDMALLVLAVFIPPLGGALLIGRRGVQAARLARAAGALPATGQLARKMRAALGRSVLLGVGGGTVQSGLDVATGQETNLFDEIAIRTVGAALGEGVVGGVRAVVNKPYKKIKAEIRAGLVKRTGGKEFSSAVEEAASKLDPDVPSLSTIIELASVFNSVTSVASLRKLGTGAVAALKDVKNIKLKDTIAKQVNMTTEQLDTALPLAMDMFKNIDQLDTFRVFQKNLGKRKNIVSGVETTVKEAERKLASVLRRHKRNPLNPDSKSFKSNKARRIEIVRELKKIIAAEKKRLTRFKKDIRKGEKVLKSFGGESPSSGSPLADAVATSDAIGFRVFMDPHLDFSRQKAVADIFQIDIEDLGKMTFRAAELKKSTLFRSNRVFGAMNRWFGEPDNVLTDGSLAKDFFDSWGRKNRFDRAFRKQMQAAFKGLSSNDQRHVYNALDRGSELQKLFSVSELRELGLTAKQMDSYYAVRKVLDFAHITMDKVLTRRMRKEGVRRLRDGRLVKLHQQGVPIDEAKKGVFKYEVIKSSGTDLTERGTVNIADTEQISSVLKLEKGYLPIIYKEAQWHVSEIDLTTGQHKRLFAGKTRAEAQKFLKDAESKSSGNTLLYSDRWNRVAQRSSFIMPNKTVDLIDTMDDEGIEAVRKALDLASKSDDGVRIEQLRVALDRMTTSHLRGKISGDRAPARLKSFDKSGKLVDAPQLYTEEAVADYLHLVAERAGLGDWRDYATRRFMQIFGPGGPKQVIGQGARWFDPINGEKASLQSIAKDGSPAHFKPDWVVEAQQMQAWLKRTITYKTSAERGFDDFLTATIKRYSDSSRPVHKAMGKALDNFMPGLTEALNAGRAVSGAVKLLMFNMGQIIVQSSQTLASLVSNPIFIPQAIGDTMVAIGYVSGRATVGAIGEAEHLVSKNAPGVVKAMRFSGWFDDLITNDITELSHISRPSYYRLLEREGAVKATLEKGKNFLADKGTAIYDAGAIPFKAGEGLNRVIAFTIFRRKLISQIKSKNIKVFGVDGKTELRVKDIDGPEFARIVTDQAKVTALNMTRPGQLQAMSGIGSLFFQFKQVLPKSINIFTTNTLTAREKFGAAAGYIGAWGPTGIPLLHDLLTFSEATYWELFSDKQPSEREFARAWGREHAKELLDYLMDTDDNTAELLGMRRATIERLFTKGTVNALTGGEIDIVNRVALGKFITDASESFDPEDMVVFLSVVTDTWRALAGEGIEPNIMDVLGQYYRHQLTGDQAFSKILRNTGRVVSTAGYVSRFIENNEQQRYDPRFNRAIDDEDQTIRGASGRDTGVLLRGKIEPGDTKLVGLLKEHRLYQYLVGLTPGPIVEEITRVKTEQKYRAAIRAYIKQQSDRYVRTLTSEAALKIQVETIAELEDVYPMIRDLELQLPLAKDPNWIYTVVFSRFWRDWVRFHTKE